MTHDSGSISGCLHRKYSSHIMARLPRQTRGPLCWNAGRVVEGTGEEQRVFGQMWSNTTRSHSEKGQNSTDDHESKKQEPAGTIITFSEKDPDIEDNEASNIANDDTSKGLYKVEIPIRMPDMGEGENRILKWYKRPGDWIKRNDILCDIQTPDFTFGLVTEDECDAVMGEIFYEASADNAVDDEAIICYIFHEGDTDSDAT